MAGLRPDPTPYDRDEVLEPHAWPITRRSEFDDYGRVDFEDAAGTTALTIKVVRDSSVEEGFRVEIDNHVEAEIEVVVA